ncbi:MAG: choice-of-anchor V domain-containing protein, partial [Crocinitomicaceae bacterium]
MIYRYSLIAFLAVISLFLISAGFSTSTKEVEAFNPAPPFSGGAGNGGLGDRTGSPLSSATCSQCHAGVLFNTNVLLDVYDPVAGASVTSYVPGTSYEVTFIVSGTANGYGFQGTALTSTNAAGGTFSMPSGGQIVTIAGRPYLEHSGGSSVSGVFQTIWTAPASGSGTITFYGIGLGVNANGGTSGDHVSLPFSQSLTEVIPTSIDYPGTPFCGNDGVQMPVEISPQSGASYSSSQGLVIDPSSGFIDVATSTAGTYTIDYNYPGGSASTSIEINPTYLTSTSATICANETLTFGSQTLDSSDAGLNTEVFQSADGCDSTVDLTLNVLPLIEENIAVSICTGETYNFNGTILTEANAGLNTAVLQAANGCDSTVNLTLSVNTPIEENISETICEGDTYDFNGTTLTEANAGLNTAVLQAANGCDSTVNLTLNVEVIDNTVSQSSAVITANQTGASYQWVDCDNTNAPISGASGVSYTATNDGNYAVEITLNGCTETSPCTLIDFLSLSELKIEGGIVFPNPVKDVFEIRNLEQFGTIESMVLMDGNGRIVQNISIDDSSINIGHLDAGAY